MCSSSEGVRVMSCCFFFCGVGCIELDICVREVGGDGVDDGIQGLIVISVIEEDLVVDQGGEVCLDLLFVEVYCEVLLVIILRFCMKEEIEEIFRIEMQKMCLYQVFWLVCLFKLVDVMYWCRLEYEGEVS